MIPFFRTTSPSKTAAKIGLTAAGLAALTAADTTAGDFVFGGSAGGLSNQVSGLSSTTMTDPVDGVTAAFTLGPDGAVFDDRSNSGLGVNSRANTDITDGEIDKFNLLGGTSALAGTGESISFSFDQPGVIQALLFDGLKDETLEYFVLTAPDGSEFTIFDSQAGFRLDLQGFTLDDLDVVNPIQAQEEDDDLTGLNLAYAADAVFTLTYGQSDYAELPGYEPFPGSPVEFGNGARFQGVVTAVPEPGVAAMALLGLASLARHRR